jgi:hypothetical protein
LAVAVLEQARAALDRAWNQEAARRDAEVERGVSAPVDGPAVVARLRGRLGECAPSPATISR